MGASIIYAQFDGIPSNFVKEITAHTEVVLAPPPILFTRCGYCGRKHVPSRDDCKGCGAPK